MLVVALSLAGSLCAASVIQITATSFTVREDAGRAAQSTTRPFMLVRPLRRFVFHFYEQFACPLFLLLFRLADKNRSCILSVVSAQQVIEEFKGLSPLERAKVTKFVVENDDSWIPDEFKQAMDDSRAKRFVEMETALNKKPPQRLR